MVKTSKILLRLGFQHSYVNCQHKLGRYSTLLAFYHCFGFGYFKYSV